MFAAREKQFEQEALKLNPGEIPEDDLALSPLKLDSQFVDERVIAGLNPYGSNMSLVDPRTAASLQSPTEPLEIPAGQPRATEDNIPSPVARASDGGKTSAPGETQTAVLEISDSSSADREGEQDEEVDKDQIEEMGEDDGVEEADEDQDEEKGDEPSEGSSEARNDETTPQVEDEGTDPPGLSADGVNVEQEQVGRVDEQVKDSEEAGTNSGE